VGTLSRDLTRRGLRSRGTRLFEEATDFRVVAVAGLPGYDLYGTDPSMLQALSRASPEDPWLRSGE